MTPVIKLYQYPPFAGMPSISPPCTKVNLVLRKMGLAFETRDIESPWQAKRVSPTGRVPAIEIDGARMCDSLAILDLLEEQFPDAAVGPRDPAGRARDRLWDAFVTDTLYWLTFHQRWCTPEGCRKAMDLVASERWLIGRVIMPLLIIPGFRKRARLHGVGGRGRSEVHQAFVRALSMLDEGLEGGPFLGGRADPGRGDIAAAAQLLIVGYAGGLEEPLAAIRAHPGLLGLPRRAFEACGVEAPSWWPAEQSISTG